MKPNAKMLQAQMGVIRVDFETAMFCIAKNLQVALIETNPGEKIQYNKYRLRSASSRSVMPVNTHEHTHGRV